MYIIFIIGGPHGVQYLQTMDRWIPNDLVKPGETAILLEAIDIQRSS